MFEGDRRHAVSDLLRQGLAMQWHAAKVLFQEAPDRAVQLADQLVREALEDAGYAVDKPNAPPYDDMVQSYCTAHGIAREAGRQVATYADLRRAMQHYGALVAELLAEPAEESPLSRDSGDEDGAAHRPRRRRDAG